MKLITHPSISLLLAALLFLEITNAFNLLKPRSAATPSRAPGGKQPFSETNPAPRHAGEGAQENYTVIVAMGITAWCGRTSGVTPPGKSSKPPKGAVGHPGSVQFDEAKILAVLEVAARMQSSGQIIKMENNLKKRYPGKFTNLNRAVGTGGGTMFPGAPMELWEFPIMPKGGAPATNHGLVPAGGQGPFRIIYSVSGNSPKIYEYVGMTEHPRHSPQETIMCPRNKPANRSKNQPKNDPKNKPNKQQAAATKKKEAKKITQQKQTGNWKQLVAAKKKNGERLPARKTGKKDRAKV